MHGEVQTSSSLDVGNFVSLETLIAPYKTLFTHKRYITVLHIWDWCVYRDTGMAPSIAARAEAATRIRGSMESELWGVPTSCEVCRGGVESLLLGKIYQSGSVPAASVGLRFVARGLAKIRRSGRIYKLTRGG